MRTERQQPVTAIPPAVVRLAMAIVAVATVAIAIGGRSVAETAAIASAAGILLAAAVALVAYVLWTGQFPPKLGRGGIELPAADVGDAATALSVLQQDVRALGARVAELERGAKTG